MAGVGIGTVSRVLNNNPNVREATRETVLSVISQLNYTPDPHCPQYDFAQHQRDWSDGTIFYPSLHHRSVTIQLKSFMLLLLIIGNASREEISAFILQLGKQ